MFVLERTLPTLAANLALDEALLLEAEAGRSGEVLRFWEWPQPAVVLGAGCVLAADVNESACKADAVPILRRGSGGGTVLRGAGCLLYSLILSKQRSPALGEIGPSYRFILDRVRQAVSDLVPGVALAGISDLAVDGRKFSGNAQQRKRGFLLHHGTLLYRFELECVGRYLSMPGRQPDYRAGRDHAAFLLNLPADAAALRHRLRRAWDADAELVAVPEDEVRRLAVEKFANEEWIRRR